MKRICPSCKSILTLSSVFFCEHCGEVLPESMHFKKSDTAKVIKADSGKSKKICHASIKESLGKFLKMVSLKSVIAGVVIGISISILFFLFFSMDGAGVVRKFTSRLSKNGSIASKNDITPTTQNDQQVEKIEQEVIEIGLGIMSGPFGQFGVRDYVPYDTPLYFEFNDSSTLEPYFSFLGGDFFTLTQNISDKIEPFYVAFYLTKGIKSGWVLLTYPIDSNLEVGTYEDVYADIIEDALVISLEPVLIDEVRLAKSEISKNLSLHPVLISIQNFLPKSGQVFILKNTKDGDVLVEKLERETLSSDFKSIVNSFKDLNVPYLVIK
ncbi:hypothetical protein K0B04_04405 [Patescibacteria group bacterium]|nr:hypothetical protein [Patescibacteria group bacterium]